MDNPLLLHIDGLSDKLTRYAASQEQEMMEMRAQLEQMRGHVIATSTTALPDAFSSNGMIISFPADSSPSAPVSHPHVEFGCIEEKVDVEDVMDSAAEAVHGLETMGARKTGALPRGLSYFNCMYERGRVHEAIDADARYAEVMTGIREAFFRRDTVGVLKRLNALHHIWKNAKQEPQTGVIAAFANSHAFAASISVIIVINCIMSIVEVNTRADRIFAGDHLYARPEIWNIFENIFLAIYIAELALRLFVSRIYFFAGHEFWWNMIDVSIVILASLDCLAGSVRAIRIFRISRLLRMVRFLRFVKTLRLLVDCLIQSVINMVSCVTMLAFIIGFFAMYFVSAIAEHAAENYNELEPDILQELGANYGSFQAAMLSLFEACSGGQDWGEYYRSIAVTGWANAGVFLFFIAFFFLAVFNIVTSVFVEKVIALAQPDIEDRLAEMQARSAELATELQQEQNRLETQARLEVIPARDKAQAEVQSRQLASECAELRETLLKKQQDSFRLEKEILPEAEKGVVEERHCVSRLREELSSARVSMDKAEDQAQALRREWLEAEAQAQCSSLQSELESAEARNVHLEEQCAEAWSDIGRAKASIASSRESLKTRAKRLSELKGVVKSHSQSMMERLSNLHHAINGIRCSSPLAADSSASPRSRSPHPASEGSARRGQLPPHGNPEEPTIAYPPDVDFGFRATAEWPASPAAAAMPAAKRKRLPEDAAEEGAIEGDRQRSSSSPSPPALISVAAPFAAGNG